VRFMIGCKYRLSERVGQLWGEITSWGVNTACRSDGDSCGVWFMVGL
jgi:hypothetical protein